MQKQEQIKTNKISSDVFERIIRVVDEFSTLPTIYSRLCDIMANPRSTAADVAVIISQDQSSASKVLKAANSSLYGYRGKISNITQAISFIGFDEVKNLVIALSIINLFKNGKNKIEYNLVDLWKHSIGVGTITKILGIEFGIKKIEDFFIAGILHDLGKLIFLKYFPKEYIKVIEYAADNNITVREAEAKILNITHTVAGAMLAERWGLPRPIINSISNHYSGFVDGKPDHLVICVHLANIIATMLQFGKTGDDVVNEPNDKIWDYLKLPDRFFLRLLPKIISQYKESEELLLLN